MPASQQKILDENLTENNDEFIRRKLIEKYNNYYRHWLDLNLLVCLFATAGLFMAIFEWESQFPVRGPDGY